MVNHSAREVERLKKEGLDIKEKRPDDGYYKWTNPDTGEVLKIPNGIDPGWAYNPGETAWGKNLSDEAMRAWERSGPDKWEQLSPGNWRTYGRPERITIDEPEGRLLGKATSKKALEEMLVSVLGGKTRVFTFDTGLFRYDILVSAETLARHVDLGRSPFIGFLKEALEDPWEVWLSFERHKRTGKVVLRERVIKAVKLDKKRAILLVAQANNGIMEAWTMIPTSDLKYINRQRRGKLIWARD